MLKKIFYLTVKDSYPILIIADSLDVTAGVQRLLAGKQGGQAQGEDGVSHLKRSLLVSGNAIWPVQRARHI